MKIVMFISGDKKDFGSYKDMYLELSSLGYIISKVEDGVIFATLNNESVEINFAELVTESTKDKFIFDVSEYKDSVKESITDLKKQGLFNKEMLAKLGEQFAFLKTTS